MQKTCINCGASSGCDRSDARRCANGNRSLWSPDSSPESFDVAIDSAKTTRCELCADFDVVIHCINGCHEKKE